MQHGYKSRGTGHKEMPEGHHSSRRSVSYSTDNKVDDDGFTLVTHGNTNRLNGGRVRGSTGDSTTTAKYYYGNDSSHGRGRGGRGFQHGSYGNVAGVKRWN